MERIFGVNIKELKQNYSTSKFMINSKSYFLQASLFLRQYTVKCEDDLLQESKSCGISLDSDRLYFEQSNINIDQLDM